MCDLVSRHSYTTVNKCTLYDVQYMVYTVYCTLYGVHCVTYTMWCTVYAVYTVWCTLYSNERLHCTIYSVCLFSNIISRGYKYSTATLSIVW